MEPIREGGGGGEEWCEEVGEQTAGRRRMREE